MTQKRALLVGINTYAPESNIPALRYAENDARDLAGVLSSRCDFQCETLLGPDATRTSILGALEEAGSGELFLFFFAGHGETVKGGYYLHPWDGRTESGLHSIPFTELPRHWEGAGFDYSHCVAILDACRTSLTSRGRRGSGELRQDDTRDIVAAQQHATKDIRTIYGCGYGQASHEFPELGHGCLTYHLLEAIREEEPGRLSLSDWVGEASDRMRQWQSSHRGKVLQTPQWLGTPTRRRIWLGESRPEEEVEILQPPKLHVTSRPEGARITLDGEDAGTAPVKLELDAGVYRVRAEKEGHKMWKRRVRFRAKKDARVRIELEEKPQNVEAFFPMTVEEAREVQRAASEALGVPVEKELDLGNGVSIKLRLIAAGEFMMGSTLSPDEAAAQYGGKAKYFEREHPRHRVRITRPFYIGVSPVTQRRYEAVAGTNPSSFEGKDNPVESLSWNDARDFCRQLSDRTGETIELPSEAQWEYACRAGSATEYCFGDGKAQLGAYALYDDKSGGTTHPVAQKKPNAWGLYDVHGNMSTAMSVNGAPTGIAVTTTKTR
jgi:formylglycine-generating enzyme required for sulfatase activity